MAKNLLLGSILCLCMLLACDDDDNGSNGGNNNSNGTMQATVAGNAWNATTVQATRANGVLALAGAQIVGGENQQINISGLVNGTGTFNFGITAGLTATFGRGSGTSVETFAALSGNLTVTELTDNSAKGSFAYTATNPQTQQSVTVADGSFDVTF